MSKDRFGLLLIVSAVIFILAHIAVPLPAPGGQYIWPLFEVVTQWPPAYQARYCAALLLCISLIPIASVTRGRRRRALALCALSGFTLLVISPLDSVLAVLFILAFMFSLPGLCAFAKCRAIRADRTSRIACCFFGAVLSTGFVVILIRGMVMVDALGLSEQVADINSKIDEQKEGWMMGFVAPIAFVGALTLPIASIIGIFLIRRTPCRLLAEWCSHLVWIGVLSYCASWAAIFGMAPVLLSPPGNAVPHLSWLSWAIMCFWFVCLPLATFSVWQSAIYGLLSSDDRGA